MNLLFFAALLSFPLSTTSSISSSPFTDSLVWHTEFEQAKAIAQQSNRHLLLVFSGSDWCRPCMKLQTELFETDSFQAFAKDNLILVKVDFPRSRKNKLPPEQLAHNAQLAERFNAQGAFPFLVMLDAEESLLDEIGYLPAGPNAYLSRWQPYVTSQ